jgi:hypothetical protein
MHVVAIHGWRQDTPDLVKALAEALGVLPFEAKQRLIGGGPAVIARFADAAAAHSLAQRLTQAGLKPLVIDSNTVRNDGRLMAQRFILGTESLQIETANGGRTEVPFNTVDLLLPGFGTTSVTETHTITERKFSLGKTLLFGGIPMTKKVTRQEEETTEEHRRYLYLYLAGRPPFLFGQHIVKYDGLGAAMQVSQELNFTYLLGELRRRCGNAVYDDRLLNRQAMAHLLGPARNPETDLDLATTILARTLRR